MRLFLAALLALATFTTVHTPVAAADKSAEKGPVKLKDVDVSAFEKMRAAKDAIVIDVRRPSEFVAGHIAGATNIDWHGLDFEKRVAALDRSKIYLIHCASGRRSAAAAGKMSGMNFTNVYNLKGGFNAWEKAGKPVEQ